MMIMIAMIRKLMMIILMTEKIDQQLDQQKIGNLCFSVTELNMYLLGSEAVVQRCS